MTDAVFRVAAYAVLGLVGTLALLLLVALIWGTWAYISDRRQTRHTVRRNFPVIGRFRYVFEHLGEFFRQYFFAMDREEMPFNRAERGWAYKAAKKVDTTVAFGSTRRLDVAGTVMFVNSPFPALKKDFASASEVVIGEHCRHPYQTASVVNISGMSFGAISRPAVESLSAGAKLAGCWMNTGEGALTPYHLQGGCDLVVQIGTAKYGVRDEHGELDDDKLREVASHEQVRMFEIKLSQGAKPGKGGILPGGKVTAEIARFRGIPAGKDSISPNGHPDIRSVDDLLDMVARVRSITGKPTGFKTVLGDIDWIDDLCRAIHRRGTDSAPDFITLDGAEGGTGASPQPLMDYMGLPLAQALPMLIDKLDDFQLRPRIRVVASGKLINPDKVAWALCVGADFVVSARGFMFALGCIQALQCNKNSCPTGITTHDPKLQRGLVEADKSVRVANYVDTMMYEVGMIAHSCGVDEPRQLRREHARLVQPNGSAPLLSELYGSREFHPGVEQRPDD
ncbi:FMN-binding glutamate synthase family protein [Bacterioplanes sanyensis]|uniref:FMN-binding glutamate synthase family protein n=1 Tax=Bacterioplanes sanyensis TaxID=1249553 RepID=A0A222FJT9_9GAMM|nr:FMN-binding glutamate synthase family protein [Bacterioplanes sanyensis]ASP38681.1 FMN-binding glutamate synthase family protein [Bacterioplanes sanyensis]